MEIGIIVSEGFMPLSGMWETCYITYHVGNPCRETESKMDKQVFGRLATDLLMLCFRKSRKNL